MIVKIPQILLNTYKAAPSKKAASLIAAWAILRKAHSDNKIRNFYSKIPYFARVMGISDSTIRRTVAEMVRQGYATRHGKNLHLTPDHTLCKADPKINRYFRAENYGCLTLKIMSVAVTDNIKQQQYRIKHKLGEKQLINHRQKHISNFGIHSRNLALWTKFASPTLSNKKFAALCGLSSISSGNRFKKSLVSMGIIEDAQRIIVMAEMPENLFSAYRLSRGEHGRKIRKMDLGGQKCAAYTFISSSVYLR